MSPDKIQISEDLNLGNSYCLNLVRDLVLGNGLQNGQKLSISAALTARKWSWSSWTARRGAEMQR